MEWDAFQRQQYKELYHCYGNVVFVNNGEMSVFFGDSVETGFVYV